jgi:hypothetical protein
MTQREALIRVCRISDNEEDNSQNLRECADYSDNIYEVFHLLGDFVPAESLEFLPSFKGVHIVEKLGILSTAEENEMRVFYVRSPEFKKNPKILSEIEYSSKYSCIKTKYDPKTGVMTLTLLDTIAR